MIDVVSIKFKSCGKVYYFAPNGTDPKEGDRVVVETANGRELAICSQGVHAVADDRVVPPLQPVLRVATPADLRMLPTPSKTVVLSWKKDYVNGHLMCMKNN